MELNDTVKLMNSKKYEERFKAEYFQLVIRIDKLSLMLTKMANGTLDFKPKCTYGVLSQQYEAMLELRRIMEKRAKSEGIDVTMPK
jgi:hypothetical protein